MLIGELAHQSGFSRDTIRYYEKIGLLTQPREARRDNNYKEYSSATVARLRAVRQLKDIGYTLPEIQHVIESYERGRLDCSAGKEQVLEKVRLIEQQISYLENIKTQLLAAVAGCPGHCRIIGILQTTLLSTVQP